MQTVDVSIYKKALRRPILVIAKSPQWQSFTDITILTSMRKSMQRAPQLNSRRKSAL